MQEKSQQEKTGEAAKKCYEKPSLSTVQLFADQVLQQCGSDTCIPPDPLRAS